MNDENIMNLVMQSLTGFSIKTDGVGNYIQTDPELVTSNSSDTFIDPNLTHDGMIATKVEFDKILTAETNALNQLIDTGAPQIEIDIKTHRIMVLNKYQIEHERSTMRLLDPTNFNNPEDFMVDNGSGEINGSVPGLNNIFKKSITSFQYENIKNNSNRTLSSEIKSSCGLVDIINTVVQSPNKIVMENIRNILNSKAANSKLQQNLYNDALSYAIQDGMTESDPLYIEIINLKESCAGDESLYISLANIMTNEINNGVKNGWLN